MLCAKDHLYRPSLHASENHSLSHFRQARRGIHLTPVLARGVVTSGPHYFGSGSSSRPEQSVNVDAVGLLGPQVNLAAKNQVCQLGRYASERIKCVHKTPVLDR